MDESSVADHEVIRQKNNRYFLASRFHQSHQRIRLKSRSRSHVVGIQDNRYLLFPFYHPLVVQNGILSYLESLYVAGPRD